LTKRKQLCILAGFLFILTAKGSLLPSREKDAQHRQLLPCRAISRPLRPLQNSRQIRNLLNDLKQKKPPVQRLAWRINGFQTIKTKHSTLVEKGSFLPYRYGMRHTDLMPEVQHESL
jgi:hypothetical protein